MRVLALPLSPQKRKTNGPSIGKAFLKEYIESKDKGDDVLREYIRHIGSKRLLKEIIKALNIELEIYESVNQILDRNSIKQNIVVYSLFERDINEIKNILKRRYITLDHNMRVFSQEAESNKKLIRNISTKSFIAGIAGQITSVTLKGGADEKLSIYAFTTASAVAVVSALAEVANTFIHKLRMKKTFNKMINEMSLPYIKESGDINEIIKVIDELANIITAV